MVHFSVTYRRHTPALISSEDRFGLRQAPFGGPAGVVVSIPSYGVGTLSVTGLVEALYILHHGKLTAVGGRFLYARHLENVVFDFRGLPLRP